MKRGNGLQRKTPLTAKTPLARGAASLPRTGPLRRSGRLNPRSAKTAAIYRSERVPLVKRLLAERPVCERCRAARSVDVHEIKRRSQGGSLLDENGLACLCRDCHRWITEHPVAAHDEGWVKWSWEAA